MINLNLKYKRWLVMVTARLKRFKDYTTVLWKSTPSVAGRLRGKVLMATYLLSFQVVLNFIYKWKSIGCNKDDFCSSLQHNVFH